MHVSNLGYAVKLLRAWARGEGTLSPFCTWIGDAKLQIASSMEKAELVKSDGHVADGLSELDAVASVLLLVSLRNKLPVEAEKITDSE